MNYTPDAHITTTEEVKQAGESLPYYRLMSEAFSVCETKGADIEAQAPNTMRELRKHFFIEPCELGRNPKEVLPEDAFTGKDGKPRPAKTEEKNFLTCLVRKTDDNFKTFYEHSGKTYTMERIPSINLMAVRYLLPMVGGMIDGYYDIERIAFTESKGKTVLRIRLGEYHNIGQDWVNIYRIKMQPGELISFEQTLRLYND